MEITVAFIGNLIKAGGFIMYSNEEFEERLEGTNQTVSEAKEIIREFEEKSGMQFKAISNFEQIHKLFYTDGFGNVYYPNEYSGSWIEGEDLYVALTNVSDEMIKKYTSNLPFPENIKFAKMAKSLNDLDLEQCQYLTILNANKILVTSSYVDVKNNKCVFEVENLPVDNAYKMINNALLSCDPKYSFSKDSIIIAQGSVSIPDTNIIGGMGSTCSGFEFSVGVCGTIKMSSGTTYEGFCSCGHGKSISDTVSINSSEFGTVCLMRYGDNLTGDFACVHMTSTDTLTNKVYGSSFSFTRNITATADDVPIDTIVMKFGKTSQYATAKVSATNATISHRVDANTTISIKGMTRCTLETGSSAGGDSGGPYYISNGSGNNYKFIGVHSSNSGNSLSFTPYVRFKSYFTPKTSV